MLTRKLEWLADGPCSKVRVACLNAVCVCVCVLGGLGELVQWRNSIGISDNTEGRG